MVPPSAPALWPLGIYFLLVLLLVAGLMLASHFLGDRRPARRLEEPFESGVVGLGFGHFRVSIGFYLVAMFFVIFDLEAVFLFAWAIALREAGWQGFAEALVFIAILAAVLIYLWRDGGLDWGPTRRKRGGAPDAL
ncbi:MAG: dehydrogenase subunit [Rhodocyclaceae bacterium]|nr:dehydrogenase subunit [Rhodocyclaceae bacterium]